MQAVPGQHPGGAGQIFAQKQRYRTVLTAMASSGMPPSDERVISGFLGGGLFGFRIGDIAGEPLDDRSKTNDKICLTQRDITGTPHTILLDENFRPVAPMDWIQPAGCRNTGSIPGNCAYYKPPPIFWALD